MSGIKERIKKIAEKNSTLYFVWRCLSGAKRTILHCIVVGSDLMRKRDKYCILCGHKVGRFAPLRPAIKAHEEIFRKYHIIGGWITESCKCPYCGSWDRLRWQYYVLKNHSGILEAGECSVLHFAAENSSL